MKIVEGGIAGDFFLSKLRLTILAEWYGSAGGKFLRENSLFSSITGLISFPYSGL